MCSLTAARAEDVHVDFAELPIERWTAQAPLQQRAFQLCDNPSAYDAVYVALAEALDCLS